MNTPASHAAGSERRVSGPVRNAEGVGHQLLDDRVRCLVVLNDIGRPLVLDGDVRGLPSGTREELALLGGDDLIMPRGDHRVARPRDYVANGVPLLQER
jgi:hypothetical protein